MALIFQPLSIGIELGARTVRAAWAQGRRVEPARVRCREQRRSDETNPSTLPRDLASALRPLRRHWFRADVTLAAPQSTMRRLTLRVAHAAQLSEAVREQLPQLLPFEVERAQVHFVIEHSRRVDGQLECSVLVAACEREALQHELEALWQAGWVATRVIPSALALYHAAEATDALGRDPVMLTEIAERATTVVLVDAGQITYARELTLGDEHLTEALTGQVSVGERAIVFSREQAEAIRRQVGVPETPSGDVAVGQGVMPVATYLAMIQPVLEQLVSEIRRTMTFGAQAATGGAPTRLLLSGVGARLPRLDQWLSQQLAMPVVPMEGGAIACGLVMGKSASSINLQPLAWRRRGRVVRAASWLWRGLALVALVCWLDAGWWQLQRQPVAQRVRALKAQWAELHPVAELHESLAAQARLVRRLSVDEGVPLEWFSRLAQEFPNPIRLTRLTVTAQRQVSLTGQAQEREQTPEASISELALWLEHAGLCRSVQLGSTHRVVSSGSLVEFALTCQFIQQ